MRQLPCKKSEIVYIVWHDALDESSRATVDVLLAARLSVNGNLGWIIHEDDTRIVLAHGNSETTGEIDHSVIPQAMILERIYPFPPRKRK